VTSVAIPYTELQWTRSPRGFSASSRSPWPRLGGAIAAATGAAGATAAGSELRRHALAPPAGGARHARASSGQYDFRVGCTTCRRINPREPATGSPSKTGRGPGRISDWSSGGGFVGRPSPPTREGASAGTRHAWPRESSCSIAAPEPGRAATLSSCACTTRPARVLLSDDRPSRSRPQASRCSFDPRERLFVGRYSMEAELVETRATGGGALFRGRGERTSSGRGVRADARALATLRRTRRSRHCAR